VLLDLNDPQSLIEELDGTSYASLKADGKVHSGMLPKLESCFYAKSAGAKQVLLTSPEQSLAFAANLPFRGTQIGSSPLPV
jgi:acetylglutamate kinase